MHSRLDLIDLMLIAEAVLDMPAERAAETVRLPSAESALAAPFASLDGAEFYLDPVERAAICCSRVIRSRPFPAGNERVAYGCLREMLERDGIPWPRPSEDAEEIATMVERLAAREVSEQEFVGWVRARTEMRPDD
jgi:prophage maintenance system killer protein